jgi:hypothetical protein
MALLAVASVPSVEAQARAAPQVQPATPIEEPLFQVASNITAFRIDSLFPTGSPLARRGFVLLGNVQGVRSVALIQAEVLGARPKWVPFQDFMSYVADSGYTAYLRPSFADEPSTPPPNRVAGKYDGLKLGLISALMFTRPDYHYRR